MSAAHLWVGEAARDEIPTRLVARMRRIDVNHPLDSAREPGTLTFWRPLQTVKSHFNFAR